MFADLALLWEWEFDEDFIRILDRKCHQFGLQCYLIHRYNLKDVQTRLENGDFGALIFYDRASDNDLSFEPLVKELLKRESKPLNEPARLEVALDKAAMHHRLIECGIQVPFTIILSPTRDWTKMKIGELMRLGEPFIIKPAIGGGGVGVEVNAKTLSDIVKAREGKSKEKFLLQEKVLPIHFGDRRAWFRLFYVNSKVISCWWDDLTHLYERVTHEEEKVFGLERLEKETRKIAALTGLQFFSTEIAIADKETYVVVDYVNDQCDMRLKSRFPDGVPDDVVDEIAVEIARYAQEQIKMMPRILKVAEGSGQFSAGNAAASRKEKYYNE
jgi:hypothetical protein